jgi:anaerobic magnesium-protoporphyrin IX monomethyl ester cyclase
MNVTLISLYGVENIGIRLLASLLKKSGHRVSIIFLKKWVNNNIKPPTADEILELLSLLRELKPKIIGIGFGSPYLKIAIEITKKISEVMDSFIIWGGIHPTICPEDCIEFADAVCVGEGEYPMQELADRISKNEPYDNVKNLWIKTEAGINKNPLRDLIQNLDSLPFPDYDNNDKYFIEKNQVSCGEPLWESAELRVCGSRGCPFSCSYCYNSTLRKIYAGKGRYFRPHSVEYVIALINYCKSNLKKIKRIKFEDDTFISSLPWVESFCEQYKHNIKIPFEILLHPNLIEENILLKLKDAGLNRVQIGIESASEKESESVYNRICCNDKILEFSLMNRRLRLEVVYDIIFDNPLAKRKDKEDLFELLLKIERPFKIFLYSLTIFPKTAIAEEFLKKGLIKEKDIEGQSNKSFKQFRLSFNYPRSKEDVFFISLFSLTSKSFIPKKFIKSLYRSKFLYRHPFLLFYFSQTVNFIKISFIAIKMLFKGELTVLKWDEYADLGNLLIQ